MKIVADLHIHSRYSRATSKRMNPEALARWAELKGINVLGTGDFTHPQWIKELENSLEPSEPGLFRLKTEKREVRFLLSSEISCIYSKKDKVRKIHVVVLAPSFKIAKEINFYLGAVGNLASDGRPILGLDAKKLAGIVLNVSPDCFIIPAHIWTPWFSLFGSKSGFDSMEECFEEHSEKIYAVETGLSSNPAMNWRLSALDRVALVSNSDAHSPEKIGREANVLETELSYKGITKAIKSKDPDSFLYTIEFFPEEGKYHYDGHRKCNICLSPEETAEYRGVCPVCGQKLTIGVLHRVEKLADREQGFMPQNAIPFKSLIPLAEIISEALSVGVNTKTVKDEYRKLIKVFQNEIQVLLEVKRNELEKVTLPGVVEGVVRVRQGQVALKPGYDGVYGEVMIFGEGEEKEFGGQKTLF